MRGEVELTLLSPVTVEPGTVLQARASELTVTSVRSNRKGLVVAFEGVTDLSSAESLRGVEFLGDVVTDELPLAGLLVEGVDGTAYGVVSGVQGVAGQELIEVDTGSGTRLVPNVPEIVLRIEDERLVVDPPEGLLD